MLYQRGGSAYTPDQDLFSRHLVHAITGNVPKGVGKLVTGKAGEAILKNVIPIVAHQMTTRVVR